MPREGEVRRQIRESLGLPTVPDVAPQVPSEGYGCALLLWSYAARGNRAFVRNGPLGSLTNRVG